MLDQDDIVSGENARTVPIGDVADSRHRLNAVAQTLRRVEADCVEQQAAVELLPSHEIARRQFGVSVFAKIGRRGLADRRT